MTREIAAALLLSALGAGLFVLVVQPERAAAEAAVDALAEAREAHRAARGEFAALQARSRRPAPATTGVDPVAVRSRVLSVLQEVALREVRLSVRPGPAGTEVLVSGRAAQAGALQLSQRLVEDAGLALGEVRLAADGTDLRIAVTARAEAP